MKSYSKTFNLMLGAMFVALTAIGANITSIVPFLVIGGVPITLQTFFATLSGLVLGSRLGAFTMFAYMLLGLVGAPVFARFSGGINSLLSPQFGFIISFILIAYLAGKIRELKPTLTSYIVAGLIAFVVNYLFGTNWMYMAYKLWFEAPEGFTYGMAWLWMLPPLPKDVILSVVAGVFAFRLQKHGLTISTQVTKQAVS